MPFVMQHDKSRSQGNNLQELCANRPSVSTKVINGLCRTSIRPSVLITSEACYMQTPKPRREPWTEAPSCFPNVGLQLCSLGDFVSPSQD